MAQMKNVPDALMNGKAPMRKAAVPTKPTGRPAAKPLLPIEMVQAIKDSPKGKLPAGLAKYMASKKVSKSSKKGK